MVFKYGEKRYVKKIQTKKEHGYRFGETSRLFENDL